MREKWLPTRVGELIEQVVDDEIVVYRLVSDDVHLLNVTTAAVWRHCDGSSSVDEIARAAGGDLGATIDVDVVTAALVELSQAGLLVEPIEMPGRFSRRVLMKRLAIAAVAIPVVTSIAAPSAAAAASTCFPNGATCAALSQCCSGNCSAGVCRP